MTISDILTAMMKFQWKYTVAATNNYIDIEIPPRTGKRHCLSLIVVSFDGAVTKPGIYVKDGNTFIFRYFTDGPVVLPFSPPLVGMERFT